MNHRNGIEDLTALQATMSHGLLSQVLGVLTDDIVVVDGAGIVVAATRAKAVVGHRYAESWAADKRFVQALDAILAGLCDRYEQIHDMPDLTGWVHHHIVPLQEAGSAKVLGAVIVHRDASALIRAERRARDTLNFMAGLVHDLRTQLNAVMGFSEMMLLQHWGPMGDERYRAYTQNIHLAGTHLVSLVNQILDLSKIEAKRHDLHEEDVDLTELLFQCCQTIHDMATRNGLAITVQADRTMPAIRVDPRLTRRVAMNLLSNAIKFTPPGGSVAASTGLDAEGRPFLTVRDSGIGIAAEHLDRVMEPFAQLDSPQARRHAESGSGLGLPLSKQFMELHGGSLHLDSKPNQGTTVTARFPPHRVIAEQTCN